MSAWMNRLNLTVESLGGTKKTINWQTVWQAIAAVAAVIVAIVTLLNTKPQTTPTVKPSLPVASQ
jgi:hypothetical protein